VLFNSVTRVARFILEKRQKVRDLAAQFRHAERGFGQLINHTERKFLVPDAGTPADAVWR
jgi:hypothetical protein